MKRIILDVIISATLLVFSLFLVLNSQTGFQPKDIIEKNIEAVGGEKAIRAVENFSFRAGSSRYFIRSDGAMKVLTGMMDPVVIIATLITREGVRQNVLHDVRLVQGLEKSRLQCLARLAGGLFSLTSFAEDLSYRGIKPFGPERHHLLVTRAFGLTVSFYVDAETFLVKRMILEAYSPDEGHFEYSYEFGPPMDIAGFRMPSVIFSAPVGSQTSVNPEPQILSEVRFNSTMDERFFEKIDINMGEVQTVPGRLKGNVLDVLVLNPIRPPFIVVTNWQSQDIEKFGLQSGDRLILEASGLEIEVTLRIPKDENDAINYSVPDARIMSIDHLRGNLYYIYFNLLDTKEAERLKSGLVALSPLGVRKKSDIPTADEIVVRYLKEMGGVKNLRAWKGMKGSGRFVFPESGAEEIPMTFWFKPPNKQRIEMVVRGQKVIYATGGTTPWYCDPTQGVPVPTPLPEEQAREAKKNDDEYPFLDYSEKGHRIELLGQESFEGRKVYGIRLFRKNGSESTHFFDAETYREVRYIRTLRRGDVNVLQESVERDFRRIGWLLMPFEIEFKISGRTVRRMIMEKIEVDPDLKDSLFQLPKK